MIWLSLKRLDLIFIYYNIFWRICQIQESEVIAMKKQAEIIIPDQVIIALAKLLLPEIKVYYENLNKKVKP